MRPFPWPDWRPLFERFTRDATFMNAFLYNDDELWPKELFLCSRGRASLIDLAWGPGTAGRVGLLGPSWEAHLEAVAHGRARYLYVWPVVSTWDLACARGALPPPFTRYNGTRYRLAVLQRLLAQARTLGLRSCTPGQTGTASACIPRRLDKLTRDLNPEALKGRELEYFLDTLQSWARKKGTIVPSLRWTRLWYSLRTQVPGQAQPLSPTAFLGWVEKHRIQLEKCDAGASPSEYDAQTCRRLIHRSAVIKCIASRGRAPICRDVASSPAVLAYLANRSQMAILKPFLMAQARRASETIRSLENDSLLSVGLYFKNSEYLMASFTGYTHAGLMATFHAVPHVFHRVHGYFFAEPVSALKSTFPVEVVSLTVPKMTYGLLRHTVRPPFYLGHGLFSDVVTLINIYVDLKHHLPPGTSLGPGFVFGAAHLLPHLPHNAPIFASVRKIRSFRGFQYWGYDFEGLKGYSLDLIVACSGHR